jgi:hypothetical protein
MSIILQAVTLSGEAVEGARWSVSFPAGVQEGHSVAINVPIPAAEVALLNYLSRSQSVDAMLDRDETGVSVALAFKVSRVRHMVEAKAGSVETVCYVSPTNRLVEHVTTFLFMRGKTNAQFLRAMRSSSGSSD